MLLRLQEEHLRRIRQRAPATHQLVRLIPLQVHDIRQQALTTVLRRRSIRLHLQAIRQRRQTTLRRKHMVLPVQLTLQHLPHIPPLVRIHLRLPVIHRLRRRIPQPVLPIPHPVLPILQLHRLILRPPRVIHQHHPTTPRLLLLTRQQVPTTPPALRTIPQPLHPTPHLLRSTLRHLQVIHPPPHPTAEAHSTLQPVRSILQPARNTLRRRPATHQVRHSIRRAVATTS